MSGELSRCYAAAKLTDGVKEDQGKIEKIKNYVRNSASYDTAAARMDASHTDFARWFLEECETGYCVHYATAATVLLRAAGISARYVEGYAVSGKAGKDVAVTRREAHAWVEYYDMTARAWCILEATPGHEETKKPEVVPGTPQVGSAALGESGVHANDQTSEKVPVKKPPEEIYPTEDLPTDPTTIPEETEVPDDLTENPVSPNREILLRNLRKVLKIALYCLLAVLAVVLQGYARILRKRKLWNLGEPNERTIWRWRQTSSLANLLSQYYPEELDDLAKKARFKLAYFILKSRLF